MNKHIPYNVIWQDFNQRKFEAYDVMEYFLREWESVKKSKKTYSEDRYRGKPSNIDELKNWIIDKSHYMFWARCEYEVILGGWPNIETQEKWDIHKQIMMNIDIVVDIFAKNIKFS